MSIFLVDLILLVSNWRKWIQSKIGRNSWISHTFLHHKDVFPPRRSPLSWRKSWCDIEGKHSFGLQSLTHCQPSYSLNGMPPLQGHAGDLLTPSGPRAGRRGWACRPCRFWQCCHRQQRGWGRLGAHLHTAASFLASCRDWRELLLPLTSLVIRELISWCGLRYESVWISTAQIFSCFIVCRLRVGLSVLRGLLCLSELRLSQQTLPI